MQGRETPYLAILVLPVLVVFAAFFLLPMARLAVSAAGGELGIAAY
jgi:hypothetical protein